MTGTRSSRLGIEDHLFESAVLASFVLHLLFFGSLAVWRHWHIARIQPLEVDLDFSLVPRSPWDLRAPGAARGLPAPAPQPHPGPAAPPQQEKPKDWVLPGPQTQQLEKPSPAPPVALPPPGTVPGGTGTGGAGGAGGSGGGTGTGEAIGNRLPRLLNMDEVHDALRRAYPEAERSAGREGHVAVGITISEDGKVIDVEILQSAGLAFDEAAKTVARKMLFEPALVRSVPTAVKVRQVIVFRLTDS